MANYQPPHNFTPIKLGENDTGAQSAGFFHPAQHAQCVTEGTPAHQPPPQTSAAKEADQTIGICECVHDAGHSRVHFNPTHTCAACKVACANNYTLEKHAAEERHKAFICTCNTRFVRLATLNRHIVAQAGPKHYCTYCDSNKGFAREDKLIDHLRASHKFGDRAIAQFRSQARSQTNGDGHASSTVATTSAGLPVSTSAGCGFAPGGIAAQAGYSAGPAAGPAGIFDVGLVDFPMFSAAELQPFAPMEDYSWMGAAEDLAGFDFSGIDFSGVNFADFDGDMDLSGMDNNL